MYACVSIPNIYRATCLRAFADLGGSEVLRSLRHWCFVAIPNLRCGFDKCRSNLPMFYWQNGGCYFEAGSIRECGRSVHGLWQKSTCLSARTQDIAWTFQLDLLFWADKSCRQNVRIWQGVTNRVATGPPARYTLPTCWSQVNLLWHDLSRFVLRVSRVMSEACVNRRQYFCTICWVWRYGTRYACTGSMIMCKPTDRLVLVVS